MGFAPISFRNFGKTAIKRRGGGILNRVKYSLDFREKPIQDILRGEKVISKDEILSSPIALFKITQSIRTAAINPQLSAIGLYLDADSVWQSLVEFLSAKKDASASVGAIPNDIKIAGKGFDVKRSFCPKMK